MVVGWQLERVGSYREKGFRGEIVAPIIFRLATTCSQRAAVDVAAAAALLSRELHLRAVYNHEVALTRGRGHNFGQRAVTLFFAGGRDGIFVRCAASCSTQSITESSRHSERDSFLRASPPAVIFVYSSRYPEHPIYRTKFLLPFNTPPPTPGTGGGRNR